MSVVVLMWGCFGTGEYEAGKENITVAYTHYKKLDYTTAYIAFSSLYLWYEYANTVLASLTGEESVHF